MALATDGTALRDLRFTNGFAALGDAFSEHRIPDGIPEPRLIAASPRAAALIGLDPAELHAADLLRVASGNALVRGMEPRAAVYSGHQFGVWAGQLGDGRAITLGTVATPHGPLDLQLKGAGRTAYSRFGDGRAVVRSSIREFLASEHLAALGVPTTRALAVVDSPLPVMRETVERAAIAVRIAPSFVRFGSFEHFAANGRHDELRTLADHVIDGWYPDASAAPDRYAAFFRAVVERTADLVAAWQAIGFEHGVLNTDNMSILGLTLDYGPYGFLEAYEPGWIVNHSDESGRYAYDQQPTIGRWNLMALAYALQPLVAREELEAALEAYVPRLRASYLARMRARLGLSGADDGDGALLGDLLAVAERTRADYPRLLRRLSTVALDGDATAAATSWLLEARAAHLDDAAIAELAAWLARYAARVAASDAAARRTAMDAVNPRFVLRNWVAQEIIEAAERGSFDEVAAALDVLVAPYDAHPAFARWEEPAPDHLRDLAVSCSS